MPIEYRIDKAAAIIRTRCFGNVTLDEVLDHFRTLREDPECPKRLDVFLDFREITSFPTAQEIRAASYGPALLKGIVRFGFCAIVVDRDGLYGMARMFGVFTSAFFTEVKVFRSATEACEWLQEQLAGSGRATRDATS